MNSWTSVFGISGRRYDFYIPPSIYELPAEAGLYMRVKPMPDDYLLKAYVGESDNVFRRVVIDDHSSDGHRRAIEMGAHCVAFIPAPSNELTRKAWEKDLIQGLRPPCNDKHNEPGQSVFAGLFTLLSGLAPDSRTYGIQTPSVPSLTGGLLG